MPPATDQPARQPAADRPGGNPPAPGPQPARSGPQRPADGPWTVSRLLQVTSDFFRRRGVDSPRLSAELLLAHVLGLPRIQLYVLHERVLSEDELGRYRELVRRAAEHEPVRYLTGIAPFYGLDLVVTRDVLIPRPETETLVETILHHLRLTTDAGTEQSLRICDLCTGSGCIALALARNLPQASVIATDISPEAAEVARTNAQRLGLAAQVEVRVGDLFEPVGGEGPFDVLTANPPYVPAGAIAGLEANVRDFEPHLALDGGPDGLGVVQRILREAAAHLVPGGRLLLEMQFDQGEQIRAMAGEAPGLGEVQIVKDLSGHERVLFARRA